MVRDFMGLNSKQSLYGVKEEINDDGCNDSGCFANDSAAQWSFPNKVSSTPHLMSFEVSQDDNKSKILTDPITSSGYMTVLTPDAFDSSRKHSAAEPQKSFNQDGQGGFHFSLTPYPVQHDVKMYSVSNQANSVSLRSSLLNNNFVSAGQNMNANVKLPLLGGFTQSSLPTIGAIAGITESYNMKPSVPSSKLTIFYAGTVNVFDDISAEKAQAIMLLAGNGLSVASNIAQTKVQAPGDGMLVSQPANTPSSSGHPSPISISSHNGAQSGSGSTSTDEFFAVKTAGVPTTPVSNVDPPKVVNAITMLASAVPQARKASLARFFEKRKERVMNAAPYNINKKSEECATA